MRIKIIRKYVIDFPNSIKSKENAMEEQNGGKLRAEENRGDQSQ